MYSHVDACIDYHLYKDQICHVASHTDMVVLIIIDEAEWLSTSALKHLRDTSDRTDIGLILMSGIEKSMVRYPQPTDALVLPITTGRTKAMSCTSY